MSYPPPALGHPGYGGYPPPVVGQPGIGFAGGYPPYPQPNAQPYAQPYPQPYQPPPNQPYGGSTLVPGQQPIVVQPTGHSGQPTG